MSCATCMVCFVHELSCMSGSVHDEVLFVSSVYELLCLHELLCVYELLCVSSVFELLCACVAVSASCFVCMSCCLCAVNMCDWSGL